MSADEPGVLAMQISASISCFLALCVMLSITYHGFFNKVFLKMVFYLSFSDFMTSICLTFGGTPAHSIACFLQGLITNYFGIASFFWSAAICYQVYLVVLYGRIQQDFRLIAMICWIIPLLASLIPLSTSTYAKDQGTPGWCFLDSQTRYPSNGLLTFWYIFSFYFWLALIMFFLTYVVIRVSYKLYIDQRGLTIDSHKIVRRILPYPFIVIVCWIVSAVIQLGIRFGLKNPIHPESPTDIIFNYILPTSQGTLSALVYFVLNHDLTSEMKKDSGGEGGNGMAATAVRGGQKNDNNGGTVSKVDISSSSGGGGGMEGDLEDGVVGVGEDDGDGAPIDEEGHRPQHYQEKPITLAIAARQASKKQQDLQLQQQLQRAISEDGVVQVTHDHHEVLGAIPDFNDHHDDDIMNGSSIGGFSSTMSNSFFQQRPGSTRHTNTGGIADSVSADIELQTRPSHSSTIIRESHMSQVSHQSNTPQHQGSLNPMHDEPQAITTEEPPVTAQGQKQRPFDKHSSSSSSAIAAMISQVPQQHQTTGDHLPHHPHKARRASARRRSSLQDHLMSNGDYMDDNYNSSGAGADEDNRESWMWVDVANSNNLRGSYFW